MIKAWNRFWFSRESPLPAAICRIGLGLLLVALFAALGPNWHRYYAREGVLSIGTPHLDDSRVVDAWCLFVWTEGLVSIRAYWWVGLLSSICLTVGLLTRTATVTLFALITSIVHRNAYTVNGEELVSRMLLFYGCFSPWGQVLSVNALLRRWRGQVRSRRSQLGRDDASRSAVRERLPMVWATRMMQINFALIYVISVPHKFVDDIDWLTGDALHWTIASDMWWTRGFMPELTLAAGGLIRKSMTWGTIAVEALFPILVCFARSRRVAVASIVALHLGIAAFIPGVTLFTLSMVAGACLFLPADVIEHCLTRILAYDIHDSAAELRRVPTVPGA